MSITTRKPVPDLASELMAQAIERDFAARQMFFDARQGKQIDGALMLRLADEAKQLEKAASLLRSPLRALLDW